VFLAYVDESGDPGKLGTECFALGCVLVEGGAWPSVFDEVIAFRRFVRSSYGVPVRAEIKASFLLRNGGPFRALRVGAEFRHRIYRQSMRLPAKLGLSVFAIVINKAELWTVKGPTADPKEYAWTYLLQRLERFSSKNRQAIIVVHDEGDERAVRALSRKARRAGGAGSHYGTGHLARPFGGLVDDPVPRDSAQSYFLQLADLSAYAAYRRIYPPSARTAIIVPSGMWDELGDARLRPVSNYGPSIGIVSYPPRNPPGGKTPPVS
jgi:Protein of unknown function (DUF3800)